MLISSYRVPHTHANTYIYIVIYMYYVPVAFVHTHVAYGQKKSVCIQMSQAGIFFSHLSSTLSPRSLCFLLLLFIILYYAPLCDDEVFRLLMYKKKKSLLYARTATERRNMVRENLYYILLLRRIYTRDCTIIRCTSGPDLRNDNTIITANDPYAYLYLKYYSCDGNCARATNTRRTPHMRGTWHRHILFDFETLLFPCVIR